jgi:hypothetical protein
MASALPTSETTGPEKFGRFYLRELLNTGGWLRTVAAKSMRCAG